MVGNRKYLHRTGLTKHSSKVRHSPGANILVYNFITMKYRQVVRNYTVLFDNSEETNSHGNTTGTLFITGGMVEFPWTIRICSSQGFKAQIFKVVACEDFVIMTALKPWIQRMTQVNSNLSASRYLQE